MCIGCMKIILPKSIDICLPICYNGDGKGWIRVDCCAGAEPSPNGLDAVMP